MGFEPTTFCVQVVSTYCHVQPWAAFYPNSGTACIATVTACCPLLDAER